MATSIKIEDAYFYAILDTAYVRRDALSEKYQALIDGGADIIQLRAKKETHTERCRILDEILPIYERHQVPLIINDDIELCLKHTNLGLHIGQDDTPAKEARSIIGLNRILGLSTHSIEQAKAAIAQVNLLNYFAVGPIFPTQTKPDYPAVGIELLQSVINLKPSLPFFAIGGINRNSISRITQVGARRAVAVSDMLCDIDTAKAVREIKAKLL